MKALILAALIVAAPVAHAETLFVAPNRVGGAIEFTNEPCLKTKANAMVIASNPATGDAITGCWSYSESAEAMRVLWDSGRVSSFPISQIEITPTFKRKLDRVKAEKQL